MESLTYIRARTGLGVLRRTDSTKLIIALGRSSTVNSILSSPGYVRDKSSDLVRRMLCGLSFGGIMEESETRAPAMPAWRGISAKVFEELGLISLYGSSPDVKLLCLQRFIRLFAYGLSTLVLVAYLEALGNTKTEIGLFMTFTLVGDVCISFLLTLFADALGRKATLALGAALMVASGIVFAISGSYWVLLVGAIVGVISPSGNEIGPFKAVEESIIAHLTEPYNRGDIYAWYAMLGFAGAASGLVCTGWVLQHSTQSRHWDIIPSYRAIYFGYAVIGALKLVLSLLLTQSIESEKKQQWANEGQGETVPLLNGSTEEPAKRGIRSLLPDISKDSVPVVIKLCLLFALDSFGSGLAPLSWITYYIQSKFNVEEGMLGTIFFVSQVLAAASMIVASSLAKKFGSMNAKFPSKTQP
ncbi:hypothetical protein DL766_006118 [Monosporascus sp. MC13-8B]|nr:hypothetical protein DL763_010334 [Monosporascus cannonballus]RYP27989.1 hypothetical protein DL766_006118 [Monosporascus sp. MC13-8B]